MIYFCIGRIVMMRLAGGGFDPPSFGLWVRHASSAPPRFNLILYCEGDIIILHILYIQLVFKLFYAIYIIFISELK